MWNLEFKFIPVIIEVTRRVTKGLWRTIDRFITKDSCTWNGAHNTGSTAVRNLKPEWWGSPLFQNYQEEKACDTRQQEEHNNNNNNFN